MNWQDEYSSSDESGDYYDSESDDVIPSVGQDQCLGNLSDDQTDPWNTSTQTTVIPLRIKKSTYVGELRNLSLSQEPPRSGVSPHGFTLKTWTHNFKKAVAAENTNHVMYCLVTYFIWFQSVELMADNGVVRLVPVRNEHLWHQLQERNCTGGVFNNRWSAFLHQQLYLIIFDSYYESIGVCGPLILSRLTVLWKQYELSLFSFPERSVSKLLTIGKTLIDAHKNGSVYFASFIFSDTALLRRKREQILSQLEVIRSVQKAQNAEFIRSVLTKFKPIYFKQRHRKNLYKDWYCDQTDDDFLSFGNIIHLIQALPLSDKKLNKVLAKQQEVTRGYLQDSVLLTSYANTIRDVDKFYLFTYRQPNVFACQKLLGQVLMYSVVFSHLISYAASQGIDVWSTCYISKEEVNHNFAASLHKSAQTTSLTMIYGVTAEKYSGNYRKKHILQVTKLKKRKVSHNEQEEIKANCGPSTIAISHQHTYPASKCHDGFFHVADFVQHCNYVNDVFPELEATYFTVMNLSYLLRHFKRQQNTLEMKTVTDSVLFDFSNISIINKSTNREAIAFCQKYSPTPLDINVELMDKVWSGSTDNGNLIFEHLGNFREEDTYHQRPRNWILGPYRIDGQQFLEVHVTKLRKLYSILGFDSNEYSFRHLVVQEYPIIASSTDIIVGRPYLFYTEMLSPPCTTSDSKTSRLALVTKPLNEFITSLKQSNLWSNKLQRDVASKCTMLAILYDALGCETDWENTFISQEMLLHHRQRDTSDLCFGYMSIIPNVKLRLQPNKNRCVGLYKKLLTLFNDDLDTFIRLHNVMVKMFLEALDKVFPEFHDMCTHLFAQDVQL